MAVQNTIAKYFDNFKGLDLRVSDLKREQGASTEETNVTRRRTGALSKRKGYQINCRTEGGNGLFNYYNRETGSSTTISEELLTVDDNLNRLVTGEIFNITYTGSNTAYYDFLLDGTTNKFYFDVYDNNVRVLNYDCGTGRETSFKTIANLVTAINALTNFSCSSSSTYTTEPAAFVPIAQNITIPTAPGLDVTFKAWEVVTAPDGVSTVLSGHNAKKNDTDFRNMSGVAVDEVLYLNGDGIASHKYDGNRVYKAGLPQPSTPTAGSKVAGSLTGDYKWMVTYEFYDAKGNIIESVKSADLSVTLAAERQVVNIPYLANTEGYATDQGTVNGAGTSSTVPLNAGHDIQAYDTVLVLDNATTTWERRKVLSVTASQMVLDESIQYANNDPVSLVSVKLWRTKAGGSLYYLLVERQNDSAGGSLAYSDNTVDANLGIEYVEPVKSHDLPPSNCKYSTVWRGQLLLTGNEESPNTVYFSDIESAEYFPSVDNSFDVETRSGKEITGIRALDNILYIFTEDAIVAVSGDLADGSFVVDTFSDEGIGCMSHHTIQEIDNTIWFLSRSGVYSISQKGLEEVSKQIGPEFKSGNSFDFNRATSFHWIDQRQYLLTIPVSQDNGSGVLYSNASSKTYVYDRFWNCWTIWTNYDFTGGMALLDDDVYFMDRSLDSATSAVRSYLKKVHSTGLTYDFSDHESAIAFSFKSHWETLGEPSQFKKYRRIKVYSLDASLDDFESQAFSIVTTVENDYTPVAFSEIDFDFSGGALGWGSPPWSTFPWGEVRLYTLKSKLNQRKIKSARVTFSNSTENQNVLISGYELDIVVPYRGEIKE